jgi:hypothetical protein
MPISAPHIGKNAMTLRGFVVGSVAALCLVGAVSVFVELSYRPTYDRSDPTYHRYLGVFERLRVLLDQRGAKGEDFVDLSELNNGEWKTACLFGGYTMPEMRALGANISENDRVRMTEAGSRGFRLAQVEEQEVVIAFVDLSNNAQFIHFDTVIGPEGQHLKRCISKLETRLVIAAP